MNLFYLEPLAENSGQAVLSDLYGEPFTTLQTDHVTCHIISDGGALVGVAQNDRYILLYLGCISTITLNTPEKSTDHPQDVARILLDNYTSGKTDFLRGMAGDYCLAVIDKQSSEISAICDPSGMRPLFYKQVNGGVCLCTQLRALGRNCRADRNHEAFLLGYEFTPGHTTFYRGVCKIPPGRMVHFANGARKEGFILESPPSPKPRPQADESHVIEALYQTLMEVLDEQRPSTKKAAVIMGGLDSALIASGLKRLGCDVSTYTFRFRDTRYNQPYIDVLTRFLGHRHRWVDIDAQVIRDGLDRYSLMFNTVASQPHYLVQTAHTARTLRNDGFVHAYTGDGCDGLFQGYPTVQLRARIVEQLRKLPQSLVKTTIALMGACPLEKLMGHPLRIIRNILKVSTRPMPLRAYIAARVFDEYALGHLYTQDRVDPDQIEKILAGLSENLAGVPLLELAYRGKSLVGLNKTKLDGSSKSSGVALVSPYHHPKLIAFVKALPRHLLRPENDREVLGMGKHILLKMVEDKKLLPRTIIYQAKRSPVNAPVDRWYTGELRPFLLDACRHLPFAYSTNYVNRLIPDRLWEEAYRALKPIDSYAAHGICMLSTYASFFKEQAS